MKSAHRGLSVRLGTPLYAGLAEALDQYCSNQAEHEEAERDGAAPSPKLAAALALRDQLDALLQQLADR